MGDIKDAADNAWRDFETDGSPSSGAHWPEKSDIRDVMTVVDTKVETIATGNGQGLITFATTAARIAFVHADPGTVGVTAQDLENGNEYYSDGSAWVLIGESPAVRLTAAEADIDTLDGRMDTAESDITALKAADVTIDGRLDAVESGLLTETNTRANADTALDGRLDTLEAIDADARLDVVEEAVYSTSGAWELAALWSAAVTGEPADRAGISEGDIVLTGQDGMVIAVTGAAKRAPRAVYRLLPGHKYEVLAAARRTTNPADPLGDAVSLRVAWLNTSKGQIALESLEDFNLVTGSGLYVFRKVVSLSAGDEVDEVAPAGTVYITPFVETYGTDGVTRILPYVRVTDLTSNTLVSADVSGLNTRVTAIETLDAGARLDALETVTATPQTAWFSTTDDAEAATIPGSVDRLVVFGVGSSFVSRYDRGVSGDFQSDDGQWWAVQPWLLKQEPAPNDDSSFEWLFTGTDKNNGELNLETRSANNVLALTNTNINAYSALAFRNENNIEQMAVGWSNRSGGGPNIFQGYTYIETSGFEHITSEPNGFILAQTGRFASIGQASVSNNVRIQITGYPETTTAGDILLWKAFIDTGQSTNAITGMMKNTGEWGFGYGVLSSRSLLTGPMTLVADGASTAQQLRLLNPTVAKLDVKWGSGPRIDFVDTDNSSGVPFRIYVNGTKGIGIGAGGIVAEGGNVPIIGSGIGGNILSLRNTHASGYSSVDMKDVNGVQRLVMGFGNASTAFANTSYILVSSADTSGPANSFLLSQVGTYGGNLGNFQRIELTPDTNADIFLHAVAAAAGNSSNKRFSLLGSTGKVLVGDGTAVSRAIATAALTIVDSATLQQRWVKTGIRKIDLLIDNAGSPIYARFQDTDAGGSVYPISMALNGSGSVIVGGGLTWSPGTSLTPANNGQIVVEFTNNTTLTFKGKGSDGTVRSATLTLA